MQTLSGTRVAPLKAALIAIPTLLLLLPVFYYSFATPFALVDDYSHWSWVFIVDSFSEFYNWFNRRFLELGPAAGEVNYRHRPLWEFYQAVSWKVLGPVPWLHYLARWLTHFAAVFLFAAALFRFLPFQAASNADDAVGRRGRIARLYRAALRLLPLALLLYLWLFFPNSPASRLGPQELYTALFLGLCTYAMALMLLRDDDAGDAPGHLPPSATPRRTILGVNLPPLTAWRQAIAGRRMALLYGLFLFSVLGLGLAKEVNIGVFLWMLLFYYGLIFYRAARRPESAGRPGRIGPLRLTLTRADGWKLLAGLPVAVVFAHTLNRVYYLYIASGFANEGVTGELVAANSTWILEGLFQTATSPIIAAGLALLAAGLLFSVVRRAIRRRFDWRMAFILFLLGQFASLYLTLAASPWEALRYWYGLIPVLALLLAFGAQYGLEWAAGRRWPTAYRSLNLAQLTPLLPSPRLLAAAGLAAFILFFVLANYYNFLYQTVVQHSTRHGEAQLFAQIDQLQAQGEYVQVAHFAQGSARELTFNVIDYYGHYLRRFYGKERPIYTAPPPQPEQRYYTIEYGGNRHFPLRQDYRPLRWAYAVADALQPGTPAAAVDAGVSGQLWYVYDNELSSFRANGREIIDAAGGGAPPLAEADFQIYAAGPHLAYINDSCGPEDVERNFMLHLVPVNLRDLDGLDRGNGFAHRDFRFGDYGLRVGETCIALYPLPDFPVLQIRTGQFVPGEEPLWQRTFYHPDAFQHLYTTAASRLPVVSSTFDIYTGGSELTYLKEPCSAADTAAPFLLHLVPVNRRDLDGLSREAGFANRDFRFGDYGLRVGETCIALYPLPDFPVLQVRTGQFIPGQEPLWQRTFYHPDALQHLYAAAASDPPAASSTFDIYNGGRELTYLKEPCSADDTAAPFFLHLVPADADNLPPAHRAAGFENRDFAWSGMSSEGRCLASVPLPNYAIDRIRTGQFNRTPNGGYRNLWQAEIQP